LSISSTDASSAGLVSQFDHVGSAATGLSTDGPNVSANSITINGTASGLSGTLIRVAERELQAERVAVRAIAALTARR
jgi:hypothetical protein